MISVPLYTMMKIALALPKCSLRPPNGAGCQFIIDHKGRRVGHVHWQLMEFAIYEEYEHHQSVIDRLQAELEVKFKAVEHDDEEAIQAQLIHELKTSPHWDESIKPI